MLRRPRIVLAAAVLAVSAVGLWLLGEAPGPGAEPGSRAQRSAADVSSGPLRSPETDARRAAGAREQAESPPAPPAETSLADAVERGVIRGRVVWRGEGADPTDGVITARRTLPASAASQGFRVDDGDSAPAAGRTTLDGDGTFALAVEGAGPFAVELVHPRMCAVPALDVRPGAHVVLEAELGAALEGRVTEAASGSPVAGASVRVFDDAGLHVATTRVDGGYRVDGLQPGEGGGFVVADGYAQSPWAALTFRSDSRTTHDVALDPGRSLTGVVRDARTQRPIGGAEVSTWSFLGRNATTDANGRFRVWGAGERGGRLTARAEGYAPGAVQFGASDKVVDVELAAARVVVGTVLGPGGEPCPGARIAVRSLLAGGWAHGLGSVRGPRADGRFEVDGATPTFDLMARGPTGARALVHVDVAALPSAEPGRRPGAVELGSVRLRHTTDVVGRLIDLGGRPVAGAAVALRPGDVPGEVRPPGETGATDDEGRVTFHGLSEGAYLAAVTTADGREARFRFELGSPPGPGESVTLEWLLPAGALLTGEVVDGDGRPVEDARVTVLRLDGGGSLDARTDALGRFAFEAIEGEIDVVRAHPPAPRRDELLPGWAAATRGDVRIVLRGLGERVTGEVVDENGSPVPMAYVALVGRDGPWGHGTLTDEAGRFELRGPRDGGAVLGAWRTRAFGAGETNVTVREYELERRILRLDGDAPARSRLAAGDRAVRLVLPGE